MERSDFLNLHLSFYNPTGHHSADEGSHTHTLLQILKGNNELGIRKFALQVPDLNKIEIHNLQ